MLKLPPGRDRPHHPLVADAVELLGGTPGDTRRRPVGALRGVLPLQFSRRVSRLDRVVDARFARLRGNPPADRLFYSASALGDFSLIWHMAGVARALRSSRHEQEALRLSTALVLDSIVVNAGVKSLFRRTRPLREEHRHLHLRRPRSSSFPSGHASSAFMAASMLSSGAPLWNRRQAADPSQPYARTGWAGPLGWYALATVVAASRVHVGIHHASDVVVGALMGTVFGRLARRLWPLGPGP